MRIAIAAIALTLTACGQPTQTTVSGPIATAQPEDAYAGSSGAGRIPGQPFTLESEAMVGLWSFDRSCGLYDLVFQADGKAEYFDYTTTEGMAVSYGGTWATADNNRVVLTVHRTGEHNARIGEDVIYNLDVGAAVTDDLVGRFARADGAAAQDITARRCPDEDRD